MSEKIMEKLDAIEAATLAKVEEVTTTTEAKIAETVVSFEEKVAALEAKVASIQAPTIVKTYKTISQEVNRMVKGQLAEFVKGNGKIEKEIKLWEDGGQYDAYIKEASTLTASGAGIGGRTLYDPVFAALRLQNPLRGVSRAVSTEASTYQFRAKIGNAGAGWGYGVVNNTGATTEGMNIWQLNMKDLNVQFPIRTAALDDIDGLESNVVSDMLAEFSQLEAIGMISNNDQAGGSVAGGSDGLRGLNQYPGVNASYTGGSTSTSAFGNSGTASSDGLHDLATYDQLTTNGNALANNVVYQDIVNLVYALPQAYWTPTARFMINPVMLSAIRGLVDDQKRPIYIDGLSRTDGIVGQLLGFDVVVNTYVDAPSKYSGSPGTDDLFPMYFGDWQKAHTIVDRLSMVLRRYDQTLPGSITFYGEKRLATSIVDPFALVRYRSTATADL